MDYWNRVMTKVWQSPAKLNLFLHITGQRDNGYHELQTAFQFIDYCDEMTFDVSASTNAKICLKESIDGVEDAENIIVKAAEALKEHCNNSKIGAMISIKKNIPMGGGLGGGSSNAATTLIALNQLWKLNLSKNELMKIALELGADVPFFIHGSAAIAQGVGEIFETMEMEECYYLVLIPDCHINTGEIFSNLKLTRNSKTIRIRAPLNWEVLKTFRNDCEAVVTNDFNDVNHALKWLSQYGTARMTGTGSCVFLPCKSQQVAQQIEQQIPDGIKSFIAKGLNQSPLAEDCDIQ